MRQPTDTNDAASLSVARGDTASFTNHTHADYNNGTWVGLPWFSVVGPKRHRLDLGPDRLRRLHLHDAWAITEACESESTICMSRAQALCNGTPIHALPHFSCDLQQYACQVSPGSKAHDQSQMTDAMKTKERDRGKKPS